jgi:hypothetical protein
MQESHGKGPASHPDPESCVDGRKAGGEALTGAHAGQPSSCEIRHSGVPTPLSEAEGHAEISATGKPSLSAKSSGQLRSRSPPGALEIQPDALPGMRPDVPIDERTWRHSRRRFSRTNEFT